jgi:lipopolysaccharide export system permease protein|tara:strand:- start:37 stop:1191 length:1155 start_codon:yes stop_codon:yes gene_type:complete
MKKILFRKILLDSIIFFLIVLISASVIIWVFQAVNYLDIIVEDGRDYGVYLNYTLLNFPKIISKIIPFAAFFSFSYILQKYESNNELMIFWNFGINKIELVNFFLKFSIILMAIQILLTAYVVPTSQAISRSIIKNSSVDFFESFVKPKKFNDNIKNLTIYADEKDKNGNLKNIYLKKDSGNNKYQITVAKTGVFKTINNSKVLVLYNGQTINLVNKKITNFYFSKSDFTLSQLDSDIIIQAKVQETSTMDHIKCLGYYFNKDLTLNPDLVNDAPANFGLNCSVRSLDNIFQEMYKRFIIPLYLPVLILISLLLIVNSKESLLYNKYKTGVFIAGLVVIVLSESALKFVQNSFYANVQVIVAPIIIMIFLYYIFKLKFNIKIKN